MDDVSEIKKALHGIIKEIEWFKAERWQHEICNPIEYAKGLEDLYIRKTKTELKLRQIELKQ